MPPHDAHSRPPRHRRPPGPPASALAYRLTFRCHQGLSLLSRDRTRHWFLNALRRARDRHGFALRAYVLLDDAAHVVLIPHNPTALDDICRSIKLPVSRRARAYLTANHPDRLDRLKVTRPSGRVEFRFWENSSPDDRTVVLPSATQSTLDDLHAHPVRAGLAPTPTDWPWSSARWHAGTPDVLLKMDGTPQAH